jgi:hypothetical protein
MRFEFLMVVAMKITAFWHAMLRSMVEIGTFGATCCLCLQTRICLMYHCFQSLSKPISSICKVIINWDLIILERSTFEYLNNVGPKFLQQFMDWWSWRYWIIEYMKPLIRSLWYVMQCSRLEVMKVFSESASNIEKNEGRICCSLATGEQSSEKCFKLYWNNFKYLWLRCFEYPKSLFSRLLNLYGIKKHYHRIVLQKFIYVL